MKKNIIHKLIRIGNGHERYLCNQACIVKPEKGSVDWKEVTCKNCIKGYHIENPLCFGTTEYSVKSHMCKTCRALVKCRKVKPRVIRKKKIIPKNGYKIQEQKHSNI